MLVIHGGTLNPVEQGTRITADVAEPTTGVGEHAREHLQIPSLRPPRRASLVKLSEIAGKLVRGDGAELAPAKALAQRLEMGAIGGAAVRPEAGRVGIPPRIGGEVEGEPGVGRDGVAPVALRLRGGQLLAARRTGN